ncbi:ABC transporter substrate-binding protein [Microbacterium soli]|uniref:ABC transporter substrate-binding protein n=1 Tax=Microbacterium soli TaxID=446075 RepID=UPI0031DFF868
MRTAGAASVMALGAFALVACSADPAEPEPAASGDDQCVIADEVIVGVVNEQSGPVSYAGVGPSDGAQVAIDELAESDFFGNGTTLKLKIADMAGDIERASSEMTKMVNDPSVSVIIGPASSGPASAVAPLVEQSKVPTVFTQAGSDGVVIGDWTFRTTPPTETYYSAGLDWLKDHGYEDAALIYDATLPTFQHLAQEGIPAFASERGIDIVSTQEVQSTTQEFSSQAQVIASENPSAVIMLITATPSITFLNQLRDSGYEGQVLATPSQSGQNMAAGGPNVDGIVYPVPFSPAATSGVAASFIERFQATFDRTPDTYNAEGYDGLMWIANAIKEVGCSTPAAIRDGLAAVGAKGFEGAQGPLTFENGNDVRVAGTMIEWSDGAEHLAD